MGVDIWYGSSKKVYTVRGLSQSLMRKTKEKFDEIRQMT